MRGTGAFCSRFSSQAGGEQREGTAEAENAEGPAPGESSETPRVREEAREPRAAAAPVDQDWEPLFVEVRRLFHTPLVLDPAECDLKYARAAHKERGRWVRVARKHARILSRRFMCVPLCALLSNSSPPAARARVRVPAADGASPTRRG